MEAYKFSKAPAANAQSIVIGPNYRFTMLTPMAMRFEWSADGVFEDRASTFAINRHFSTPEYRVVDQRSQLQIITPQLHLTYDKQKFSPHGFVVSFKNKQTLWGTEWRYGNDVEGNLGGTARTLDGVDGRCDLGLGVISTAGYTVLDDSESMLFDDGGFMTTRRSGDHTDGYIFSYALDFKDAIQTLYAISGSAPPIPRWCLGNWWSRYYAYHSSEYLRLMDKFRSAGIPLSVAVVDMDWHKVKGDDVPHSGWTGYTWDEYLFGNPEQFAQALHDKHLKMTLNDHPHAGVHHHEKMYQQMADALGHTTSQRDPIPFDPTSPAFIHAYLNVLHRKLEAEGCDFWWIDWQQGATSRMPGLDPLWVLNHFQYLDQVKQKGGQEALVFSRYAGPGSHRYPVGFSGDSAATWASLKFQPEFTATASNIGFGWWSHDIGGHFGGIRDDECFVRWVQLGVFSPIMRLHSANSRWTSKEPWLYRKESKNVVCKFLQLRHRLVPYIYSMTVAKPSSLTGRPLYLPLVQPMYWSFPKHDSAYKCPKTYYFGSSLIVAPIVEPRDRTTNLAKTKSWIPPGRHVDIFTGYVYDGDQEIDMYRALDQIPVLAAEGTIIPLDNNTVPANGCRNPEAWEVYVVVGKDGQFDIWENTRDDQLPADPGKDLIGHTTIEYNQAAGQVKFFGLCRPWTLRFVSLDFDYDEPRVTMDGVETKEAESAWLELNGISSMVVQVPASKEHASVVVVELGPNPQLAISTYEERLEAIILDAQISNDVKEDIWKILQFDVMEAVHLVTVKLAKLKCLELEAALFGPLAELLLADSRMVVRNQEAVR